MEASGRSGTRTQESPAYKTGALTSLANRPSIRTAGATGLEPAASGVTGRRSNQLSYTPKRHAGLEPATFCMASRRSSQLS